MQFLYRKAVVAAAFVLSLSIAACDFTGVNEAIDGFKVIIGLEQISTPLTVRFVDAGTGELIASSVELAFAGADGDAVVDLFNDPISAGKARFTGGVASFGMSNELQPSTVDPVVFRLTARAAGYEPQVKTVRLTQEGRQSVIVRLTAEGEAPNGGSATRVQSSAAENGTLTESIHVSTPPSTQSGGSASVRIPAGATARTADGSLLEGPLTTNVAYAPAGNRQALASFPGGFSAEVAGGQDGVLTSVGFATISLQDASGSRAKTFTQPIEIGIDVPPGTLNPLTGVPVVDGDELDVFSFDVDEGIWRREGKTTITSNGSQLRAQFQAEHLSTWNLGFILGTCAATVNITTNGNSVTSIHVWNDNFLEIIPVPAVMQQLSKLTLMPFVPTGAALHYLITGSTPHEGFLADPCGGVHVSPPTAVQTASITLENSVTPCPSGQSLKAGYEGDYGIEVAEVVSGKADWEGAQTTTVTVVTDGNTVRGTASLMVKENTTYRVQGSFNEEEITGSFSTPASITPGQIIEAEIDNQITDDIAADACQ